MTCTEQVSAFGAFENQLKTLCLQEFPCGVGSWSQNHGQTRKEIQRDKTNTRYPITLKDYGINHDKTETLEELVTTKKSPWNLDYSWSNEAKKLREIAVRSPWLIDKKFIFNHFETLRILDKNVTDIDENFLEFGHLKELSLSANQLTSVNSRNLPSQLSVLELCANNISNLSELCVNPPPLMHLGLGHNRLAALDDYITGEYWPKLLSLDLSHNDLCDIMDNVRKLQSLPKLRNLILLGNPLAIVPGYRGYVVDSLRNLSYLDDINISADEKHHYKGLSKRKEYILDEAKVQLHVSHIKGIPIPDEISNPEDQPEYPLITRRYYVQFMYLEDKSESAEVFQILHDDDLSVASPTQTPATYRSESAEYCSPNNALIKDVDVQQQTNGSFLELTSADNGKKSITYHELDENNEVNPASSEKNKVKLSALNSESSAWQEEIVLNWNKVVIRDDLLGLRNFFTEGMTINVVEEKILSYPTDQMQDGTFTPVSSQKAKDKKGKKDDKNKEKAPKDDKKDDKKKDKKKKGEADVDLTSLPPEITNLATFTMDLSDLLEGTFALEESFSKDMVNLDRTADDRLECTDSRSQHTKEGKKDKKKPASARKGDDKDKKEKGKKDEKATKGKKPMAIEEGEEMLPPPPLEIDVILKLHHWKTAMDSMKTEQSDELPNSES